MDKAQARERRNRMLDSAAAAQLSLTEGVREMRAISGMTQEEFARHREVSARAIKALELGQGNPTVATLNKIGQFFGLEVGFVPVKRTPTVQSRHGEMTTSDFIDELEKTRTSIMRDYSKALAAIESLARSLPQHLEQDNMPRLTKAKEAPNRKK